MYFFIADRWDARALLFPGKSWPDYMLIDYIVPHRSVNHCAYVILFTSLVHALSYTRINDMHIISEIGLDLEIAKSNNHNACVAV